LIKESKVSGNRLKIKLHFILSIVLLIHCAFFVIYWLSVGNFRADVDQYIENMTGWQLPYVTLVIVFAVLLGGWSLLRFVRFRLAARKGVWKPTFVNWIYFLLLAAFLFLFYSAFMIILQENPSQKGVLTHLFSLMRLGSDAVLFLLVGICLRRIVLKMRGEMRTAKPKWPWAAGIFLVLVSLVGLWLVPALFPPNWAYKGDLPAKPALIAHRGASMLAPENTLAAAELAVVNQAFGFETDVRITLDGVPILMHDETLARTTDIAEVYPDRVDDRVSSFTLDELRQLNAGLWFIQKDPFGTINSGEVSQTQLGINQGQSIPTLAETLVLMERKGMVIIFDMRYPPSNHPHHSDFFDIVFEICRESGLDGDIWFLVDREHLSTLQDESPQLTRVIGSDSSDLPKPEKLLDLGYEIVNVDSGIISKSIEGYRAEGLGVNVYTIDQPWLFSQFWLSGVTSITTNNVHLLSKLDRPFLNIPYSQYILFWGLYGIIISIWLAASQPKPEKEEQSLPVQPAIPEMDQETSHEFEVIDTQSSAEVDQDISQVEDNEGL